MTDRVQVFESDPVPGVSGLTSLSGPNSEERVRAVIDIPLIGPPRSGKSQFAATLLRTLKARAPELPTHEAHGNRVVMRSVMGASPAQGPRSDQVVPHYTFRVSVAALLEMLPATARVGALLGTHRVQLPIGSTLVCIALSICGGVFLSPLLAAAFASASLLLISLLFVRSIKVATARAENDGEVELVLWDPPGDFYRAERAADTYDFLAHLARRRQEARLAWRGYSFLPALVINPIDFGTASRRSELMRMRGLLPMFAALDGEKPRALVAINRWTLVAGACPNGACKDDSITAVACDRDGQSSRYELSRMAIASDLVETEDGNEAGVDIRYLRYESATDAEVEFRNDAIEYTAQGAGGSLVGVSRVSLVRSIAELALAPTGGFQGAMRYEEGERPLPQGYEPDEMDARVTLEAMTEALHGQ